MPKEIKRSSKNTVETKEDLKRQTTAESEVKKGYNEKNPVQPQGSFKPDSRTKGK